MAVREHELAEIDDVFNRMTRHAGGPSVGIGKVGRRGAAWQALSLLLTALRARVQEVFGEYFSYPGILRDRIFEVFDANGDQRIDREEFMRGLIMCCRGNTVDKLRFWCAACTTTHIACHTARAEPSRLCSSQLQHV